MPNKETNVLKKALKDMDSFVAFLQKEADSVAENYEKAPNKTAFIHELTRGNAQRAAGQGHVHVENNGQPGFAAEMEQLKRARVVQHDSALQFPAATHAVVLDRRRQTPHSPPPPGIGRVEGHEAVRELRHGVKHVA